VIRRGPEHPAWWVGAALVLLAARAEAAPAQEAAPERLVCAVAAGALAVPPVRAATPAGTEPGADRAWSIGLLPVTVRLPGADENLRGAVEQTLDAETASLPNAEIVDRTQLGRILDEIVLSHLGRKDLQAGRIVGAEILIASRLAPQADGVRLTLDAVETATGNVPLSHSATVSDEADVRQAVRRFVRALPEHLVRRPEAVDVALLPIEHESPFPGEGGLAEGLRTRLAERLAAMPNVRILHRELGEFVLVEASLAAAGLVDPERTFAPVAGAIAVHGNLTQTFPSGKAVDQSQLALELKVSRGGEEKEIRVAGILAGAAAMETEAVQRLAEAIAALTGTPAPPAVETDDRARRYWEAQKYLVLAKQMTATYELLQANSEVASALVLKAAILIPDSPEPYEVTCKVMRSWIHKRVPTKGLVWREPDDPAVVIRRQFIEAFPEHPLWPEAVGRELVFLTHGFSDLEKINKDDFQRAAALAIRLADSLIQGRNRIGDARSGDIKPAVRVLVMAGRPDKAFDLCVAAMPDAQLCGWSPFSCLVWMAIDYGQFEWALKAAEFMQEMYPGYDVGDLHLNKRVDVLKASEQCDRWRPIIEGAARKAAQEKETSQGIESQLVLPPWGSTVLVDARPLEGLVSHRVPKGRAMSVSAEGGTPWAVLRNGQEYFLWRIGDSEPIALDGIPPLYPPGTIYISYVMRPPIASFGGRVYVGAEQHGLYAVDPATGKTTKVTDGFPDGSVYSLVVRDGALYAAGGGEKAGYIARLTEGRNQWTVWMAPKSCGYVRRLLPRDAEPWRVFHPECTGDGNRPDRLSRFDPASGQWEEDRVIGAYSFQPSLVAATERLVLFHERYWDSQDPLYLLDEATGDYSPLYFPPANLSVYTPDRHEWLWNPKICRTMRMAPLQGYPTDVFSDGDALWVLDASGCLSATRDGDSFLGPLKVAPSGHSLARTTDTLFVSNQDTVVLVPMETLRGLVRRPDAFRSSEEIREEVRRRLEAWLDQQPPLQQAAYLMRFADARANPDLRRRVLDAYKQAAVEATAQGSPEKAIRLSTALGELGAYDEAAAVFMPFTEDPGKLDRPSAECTMLYYMQQAGQWKELAELVPRLWKESPLRNVTLYHVAPPRVKAYLRALYYTNQKEAFEKAAWAYVHGEIPELQENWREKPYLKYLGRYVHDEAAGILRWYLEKEGRGDEIRGNPLFSKPD